MEHPFHDDQPLSLDMSGAVQPDSSLTSDASGFELAQVDQFQLDSIDSDQFQPSLDDIPSFSDQPFQHSHPFEFPIDHNQPLSSPFDSSDRHFLNSSQSFDHGHLSADSHFQLNAYSQRLGSAEFKPDSPADILKNADVLFKGPDHKEHSGTVMHINPDMTYTIQTSDASYEHVAYTDILKYGSK